MTRRPEPVGTKRPANVSNLQNEITPGVYYESSKTLRELMMRQLSMGGKGRRASTRCAGCKTT